LNKGALVEEASPKELFTNPKQDYTRMLLNAAPKML
jgi:ABC-type dipeptide/oligopeptide/nickel transport system ATPase component